MLAATLTMAPIHSFRLTSRNKTDRAAQATTFELLGCATHNLILSSQLARRFEALTFDRSARKPVGEIRRSRGGDVSMFILLQIIEIVRGRPEFFNRILEFCNAGHRRGASHADDRRRTRSRASRRLAEFIFLTKSHGMHTPAMIVSRQIRRSFIETTC